MHHRHPTLRAVVALLIFVITSNAHADFDVLVPMIDSGAGNFSVQGSFGGDAPAAYLVDTGAALTTISQAVFKQLRRTRDLKPARRVAARLADGKLRALNVYQIDDFRLGDQCHLGTIEVAVMANDGRNILGMSALAKTAPFGLHLSPAALAVSQCTTGLELAAH